MSTRSSARRTIRRSGQRERPPWGQGDLALVGPQARRRRARDRLPGDARAATTSTLYTISRHRFIASAAIASDCAATRGTRRRRRRSLPRRLPRARGTRRSPAHARGVTGALRRLRPRRECRPRRLRGRASGCADPRPIGGRDLGHDEGDAAPRRARTHTFVVERHYTCSGGAGTFSALLVLTLEPDFAAGTENVFGTWVISGGTGDLANLRGAGRTDGMNVACNPRCTGGTSTVDAMAHLH
jgi:hypothetical protein